MKNTGNLGELLLAACNSHYAGIAIESATSSVTYIQMQEEADVIASRLKSLGARRNEPVHVRVSNQPRDFCALLGVWIAGCVAVPVHRTSPAAVTDRVLEKTQARFVIDVPQAPDQHKDAIEVLDTPCPPDRALLDDAALIIFTSGSTGAPKGVVVTHCAFSGKLSAIDAMVHFRKGERTLLLLNITFSFGIWVGLLTLMGGGTLVLPEKFDPASLLAQLRDQHILRVGVVPTMLRALLALSPLVDRNSNAFPCPRLRQILTGGEQLTEHLAHQVETLFPNADLINIFGLTETSTCDFFQFPDYRRRRPAALGLPSSNVEFRVVDETQSPVQIGTIGELQLRSPYLMKGYLDEPQLTSAAFSDSWFRTGDLAVLTPDGDPQLMGRQKELIVRGGNKITPMEIEQATMMFKGVGAAMAVGIPDEILGERIHVLVVPCAGSVLDLADLRAFLYQRLEKYKVPDFFYVAEALPIGRTGKADRRELRSMICSGSLAPLTSVV